ncbi:HD domain-containing protein [Aliiroseovarius sp. KMU-50]|uniref:HD domain-containing protein n=1 Tax=Aliiroseovarius salicola TaxID=3009082 RepID=A0ABT4W3D6_9RHOB|nr:HD domain-containing protein [Aliiroseovarius sp. KMU-50]MDA5095041.1 HD domain-containing protein [Aliiroseovarius sp. KMU-50]
MAQSAEALRQALRNALRDGGSMDAAHDLAHADRVWLNARIIARGEGVARCDQLMAACYLHDLVTLPKNDPARHRASYLSAKAARPLLTRLGFSTGETDEVCHAIEAHSFSADIPCDTLLAKVVQDADRIESLGAIGLARCFAVSGVLGRPLFHGEDPFGETRELDDTAYAVDHFRLKLLSLPDQMKTETGRGLARSRAEVLRRFLMDLAGELGQTAPNW